MTARLRMPRPLPTHCQVAAELARRSLRDFIEQAWPEVEPARPLINAWHLHAIADHLQAVSEGQIRHLLINVPPGHGKSLAVGDVQRGFIQSNSFAHPYYWAGFVLTGDWT